MKYTRYNVRKNSNESIFFIIIIVMVLVLAYIIGSIASSVFFSKTSIYIKNNKESNIINSTGSEKKGENTASYINYIVVKGGSFEKKEDAETMMSQLQTVNSPFLTENNGKYEIVAGFFSDESKAEAILKILNDKKLDAKKVTYKISKGNMCNAEILGIIDGCLQIVDKLNEKNVHAVQTSEFKKWTGALKEVEKNSSNISVLNNMKSYINSMPNEVSKENIPQISKVIFETIKMIAIQS